ncbi:MAG: beta-lactamase family protein [Myxococcales bacterium]|nr:beta-lactamase family protein [Myxococcales bacterium]
MTIRSTAVGLAVLLAVSACSPTNATPTLDGAVGTDAAIEASTEASADAATLTGLAAILEPIRERRRLPALAALVADERTTIVRAAVGRRSVDDAASVTLDDKWHIGSCTKAMTATLFARLVERGTLRWDTTLDAAFSDIAPMIHPTYRAATLEQLLQHRAGVSEQIPMALWSPLWMAGDVVAQRRTFAAAMLARAPSAQPGERYLYSNAGYMIAGAALERASVRSWEELVRQEIFAPLGMTSCGFGAPATPDRFDQPYGHESSGDTITTVAPGPSADNPPATGPSGTVHCSLEDWSRFAQVHLRGARGTAESFLSAASFLRMHTAPAGGTYAHGWVVADRPWAGGRALAHSGSNTTFLATIWIAPARNRVLLVATNIANADAEAATQDALLAMIAAYVSP